MFIQEKQFNYGSIIFIISKIVRNCFSKNVYSKIDLKCFLSLWLIISSDISDQFNNSNYCIAFHNYCSTL